MDTVRLRIVGVFFDDPEVPWVAGNTIKNILDAAVEQAAGQLVYASDVRFDTVLGKRLETVRSFQNTLDKPLRKSLGGRKRDKGTYEIEEQVEIYKGVEIVRAWQYYVIRKGGAVSNASDGMAAFDASPVNPSTPPNKPGFTPFTEFTVNDGDEIIWRNVSIARSPRP
jgi:hypothetical protein